MNTRSGKSQFKIGSFFNAKKKYGEYMTVLHVDSLLRILEMQLLSKTMVHNSSALLEVIKYMYEHIMYAEINTKSCYCEKCGFDGEIPLIDENGTLKWKCPKCGNDDNTTMDIAFRVCGYIGTAKNGGNQGRYGDIHDRVRHIDDMEYTED